MKIAMKMTFDRLVQSLRSLSHGLAESREASYRPRYPGRGRQGHRLAPDQKRSKQK